MKTTAIIVSAVLILAAGGFGNYLRYNERMPDRGVDFDVLPYETDYYFGEERRFSEYSYEILKADTTTLRLFNGLDGNSYWLFIAYFASQKYGSQIHSPKHCLPGGGWRIQSLEACPLSLGDGRKINVNRLVISERERRQLMFYWFQTRGGIIRNEFELKWDLMRNSLLLRPTDAAIIRLTMPLTGDRDMAEATEKAERFLRTFYPRIEEALPFSG